MPLREPVVVFNWMLITAPLIEDNHKRIRLADEMRPGSLTEPGRLTSYRARDSTKISF